ncbi:MAG: peptide chain release factor N(5)-glutamine methyltransferase, partial [Bacteroidia bacterium]|nr:peptide chain release factor N(5)-glutamine methyltransferase [Bacteroidia bacterium]
IYPDRESASIGRLVLESVTGLSWVHIRLNYDKAFTPDEESRITEIIAHLEKHEPVQYVLGETEFYGLKLKVRPGVLIPRGETEELVEWIVKCRGSGRGPRPTLSRGQAFRRDDREGFGGKGGGPGLRRDDKVLPLRVLDIGCGSGAIAIVLAKYLPDAEVVAVDISKEALQLTNENAILNGLGVETHNYASLRTFFFDILSPQGTCHPGEGRDPVTLSESFTSRNHFFRDDFPLQDFAVRDGVPAFAGMTSAPAVYDIIVSNPPYVPHGEMTAMDLHVIEYEPKTALFVPDNDPLIFYRAIAEFAASHLTPGGQVFVEIHDRLGQETFDVFRKWFLNVDLRKDIHGKDRMIRASNG